jgi:hypothetical protein
MSLVGRGVEVFVVVNVVGVVVVVVGWLIVELETLVACAVSAVVWGRLRSCFGLCCLFFWLFGCLFWLYGLRFVVCVLPCCGGVGYPGCNFAAEAVVSFGFGLRFCCSLVLRRSVVVSW